MTTDRNAATELEGVVAQSALVEYQPGAVVSRTLVKKAAGTVMAFAFDVGEGLSEHTDRPHAVQAVTRFKMILIMIRP